MNVVRLGIIGMGNMGTGHAKHLYKNEVEGTKLTAICDEREERLQWVEEHMPGVECYSEVDSLLASGSIDAVLIATPHYSHPDLAVLSFKHGLHVMIEKPAH